jgi:hypothetical protein
MTAATTRERPPQIRWESLVASGALALVHPGDARFQPDAGPGLARLQPARAGHGGPAGPGDLVAILPQGAGRVEIRRVLSADASPWEGPPSLRLGPALPRREWPAELASDPGLRAAAGPAMPEVRRQGSRVELLSAGGDVAVSIAHDDADALARRIALVASRAAGLAERDADPAPAGFTVERSRSGPREWRVLGPRGDLVDSLPRRMLERTPSALVRGIRRAAELAYETARADLAAAPALPAGR